MRVTMVGHATLLVESAGCVALVDPVLFDPHQEGLFHVAPPREVRLDALPPLDVVIVSHRHLDHFDVRSLARLDRDVEMVVPDDELVRSVVARLGFARVRTMRDFDAIAVGGTTIVATRSEARVPEHGLLFRDASGALWDAVDTVLSDETIERVRGLTGGPVDVMLAAWQPLLENDFQVSHDHAFPTARYARLLDVVRRAAPRAVVPGACGFAYVGAFEWMNHLVFPVARARWCDDAVAAAPHLDGRVLPLDPGDTLVVDGDDARRGPPSPFVRRRADVPDPSREFRPVDAPRPVTDDNPDGVPAPDLERIVTRALTVDLPAFVAASPDAFAAHRRWPLRHQVEVVFPSLRRRWSFDYGHDPVVARAGDDPRANLFTVITASALAAIVDGRRAWDWAYLSGSYRTSRALYRATAAGLDVDGAAALRDPIRVMLPLRRAMERVVERELARYLSVT